MAFKKTRTGRFTHLGWFPFYRYEDRDGVQTLTGVDHLVQFIVEITDGPDTGREVRVTMTRAEAKAHAHAVMAARTESAEKAKEYDEAGDDE